MDKIRIAVCEDKEKIVSVMVSAVERSFARHGVEAEIETFSAADALWRAMQEKVYDLLFLDIGLPRMDGITFGEKLRSRGDRTDIIYVSAREDQVFASFKVHPFAFVRKSNFQSDLTRAIDGYCAKFSDRRGDTIVVQSKSGVMNIPVRSIVYFEGSGKMQLIHVEGKQEPIGVYRSMEALQAEFAEKGFIRIHKGLLVNCKYIARLLVDSVELLGGEKLPLSRRRAAAIRKEFLDYLKNGGSSVL